MKIFPACIIAALLISGCRNPNDARYTSWRIKGGTASGIQYSSLDQVNKDNVKDLHPVWIYRSGGADTINNRTQIQCNPIIVDGILYATSASLQAFAVDAATGRQIWKFDPPEENHTMGVNRGVTYWQDGDDKRILYSFGEYLYALSATDGNKIESFGDHGRVSLKEGLGTGAKNLMVLSNTPGVIYNDLIIVGSRVHEGPIAAPGYIRAFNVKTGALAWVFHTIPMPGEFGYETWPGDAWQRIGGANAWSGMSIDHERALVFASTGSPSFDFYGGNRKGQNLFANCILALDAATGKRKWHYQIIHHDLWDRDLPASPILITVDHAGTAIDAVAQVTKTGYVYVFNRDTGEPLFPIDEVPADSSDLDGEHAWPSQPVPKIPMPFARQVFTEDMVNTINPKHTEAIKEQFKKLRTGKQFIPPSKEGTIIFPGFDGGAEWGGPAFDPTSGVLYVNANEMPWILTMVDVRPKADASLGLTLYRTQCATCHGLDRGGDGHVFPALRNLESKFDEKSLQQFILNGKGVMPAFTHLSEAERSAIARYVLDMKPIEAPANNGFFERDPDILYSNTGYNRFLTPDGYPAVQPPWGTMNAIDLNKGELLWQVPLGEFEELKKKGVPPTGTENYGGSFVTAGGLVFIAASRDEKIRAFDKDNGNVLWEHQLPAGGYATPACYEIDGKQFIVIACGGGKIGTKSGDYYIAFTLKK